MTGPGDGSWATDGERVSTARDDYWHRPDFDDASRKTTGGVVMDCNRKWQDEKVKLMGAERVPKDELMKEYRDETSFHSTTDTGSGVRQVTLVSVEDGPTLLLKDSRTPVARHSRGTRKRRRRVPSPMKVGDVSPSSDFLQLPERSPKVS